MWDRSLKFLFFSFYSGFPSFSRIRQTLNERVDVKVFWNVRRKSSRKYYDYVWNSFLHLLNETTLLCPIKTLSKILSGNSRRQKGYESGAWAAKSVKSSKPGYVYKCTLNLMKASFQVKVMKKFWSRVSTVSPESHCMTKRLNNLILPRKMSRRSTIAYRLAKMRWMRR